MENEVSVFSLEYPPNLNATYEIAPSYVPQRTLDCLHCGTKDGTILIIWDRNGGKNQEFKFHLDKDLNVSIEPMHAPGKVLDVKGGKPKNTANIQLSTKNDSKSQKFKMVRTSDNCYIFFSCYDLNYAIDVLHSGTKNETKVVVFTKNYTKAQKFVLFQKKHLPLTLAYALKYAEEENPNFKTCDPNCANFCSQCLLAGGQNEDDVWNRNSYAFINETMFREYFIQKNVKWKENVPINEVESGDIIYSKNDDGGFCTPLIVVKTLKRGIIYCGNTQGKNKGMLNVSVIPGVLKTNCLFADK
jgi:5-hydroxyisourate hydrolase-like protein (transthyretin family)